MSKSAAGPPPFTITCEPPSPNYRPPSYDEVTRPSEAWANPGANQPWSSPATVVPEQSQHISVYPTVPKEGYENRAPTQEMYQNAPVAQTPYQQVNENTTPVSQQPQHGFTNPQADRSTTVVYVSQPPQVIVGNIALPHVPARLTCPSCRQTIQSRVEHKASTRTHLWAFGLCLFGCWPCCLFPYCMDSCRNANHYCTSCGTYIGTSFD